MWALTGPAGGRQGSPAGWRSSVGVAAPSRCRGGRGRSRSWLNLWAYPEPLSWGGPISGMGSAQAKTSDYGGMCQRRRTEVASLAAQTLFFCYLPAGGWCHCNTCCTSSRPYGGSSLPWCTLSGGWKVSPTCCDLPQHLVKSQLGTAVLRVKKQIIWCLTWQLLFDEREHCEVNLAVCNNDLPLKPVDCGHPRPLRVHLPTRTPDTSSGMQTG